MKNFTSVHDISNPENLVQEALELKKISTVSVI